MAKLDKEEWLVSNLYDFEENEEGNLMIVKNETHSNISVIKETLPNNSITKYLVKRLRDRKQL